METKKKKTALLTQKKVIDLLAKHGFRKEYDGIGSCTFKRINDNVIEETGAIKIKDFIIDYLTKHENSKTLSEFYAKADHLIDSKKLELLPELKVKYLEDTKDKAYYAFSNVLVTVSKEEIKGTLTKDIDTAIKLKRVIQRELNRSVEKSEFEKFLELVSEKSSQRLNALKSAIGYLLHNYRDPSITKAIIFIDEEMNETDEANGGTGKSLVAMGIKTFLGEKPYVVNEDGRNFNTQRAFAFQQISKDTRLLVFNDTASNFPFNKLISIITDGVTVEKKYRDSYRLELPKVLITTNFLTEGDIGNTSERRKFEIEFSDYFGKTITPKDVFGHLLFNDWDEKEWNRFYYFMLQCVQLFLSDGLINPPQVNIFRKKIIKAGSSDVLIFLDTYFEKKFPDGEVIKCRLIKGEIYTEFKTMFSNSPITNTKLPKLVKMYLDGMGIKNEEIKPGGVRMFEINP